MQRVVQLVVMLAGDMPTLQSQRLDHDAWIINVAKPPLQILHHAAPALTMQPADMHPLEKNKTLPPRPNRAR
jgi:hypothetical protein